VKAEGLYVVLDRAAAAGRELAAILEGALAGGARMRPRIRAPLVAIGGITAANAGEVIAAAARAFVKVIETARGARSA